MKTNQEYSHHIVDALMLIKKNMDILDERSYNCDPVYPFYFKKFKELINKINQQITTLEVRIVESSLSIELKLFVNNKEIPFKKEIIEKILKENNITNQIVFDPEDVFYPISESLLIHFGGGF